MLLKKINWQSPSVLIFCFLLVVVVRFNRNDLLVKRSLGDAAYYIGNVEFLRGDKILYGCKHLLMNACSLQFFAAPLPFDPMTSINIINVIFLLLSIYYLYKTLKLFELNEQLVWTGLYLFVFSFPTFYYSTIGYIDSGVLLAIFAGTYAVYSNKYWLFFASIIAGTLAKEGAVLLVPVAMAYAYSYNYKKWYLYASLGLLLYFVIWGAVKYYIPNSEGDTPLLFWQPIGWRVRSNFTRFNSYFSSVCSFGIPGLLLLYMVAKRKTELLSHWKKDLPLWVGAVGGYLLWFYTLFSAHTDGRFFWVSYCFPITLAMVWLNRYGSSYFRSRIQD